MLDAPVTDWVCASEHYNTVGGFWPVDGEVFGTPNARAAAVKDRSGATCKR